MLAVLDPVRRLELAAEEENWQGTTEVSGLSWRPTVAV
jgi:hypothetical protein